MRILSSSTIPAGFGWPAAARSPGMMPYGDANAIVVDMASEVLPVVKRTPVLAGICGTDPFRLMPVFLKQIKEMGFSGVQNFPTVGLIDGVFRANSRRRGWALTARSK